MDLLITSSSIFNIFGRKKTQKKTLLLLIGYSGSSCTGIMVANEMPGSSPECAGHAKDYFEVLRIEDNNGRIFWLIL